MPDRPSRPLSAPLTDDAPTRARRLRVRRHRDLASARSAGWDRLAGLPPWLLTRWLAVFAEAGGPLTEYIALRDAERGDELVGVALLQHLPIAEMTLGSVSPTLTSVLLGRSLRQFGQALFSGPGGMHFLPDYDAAAALAHARCVLNADLPASPWIAKDLPAGTAAPAEWTPIRALDELALEIDPAWRTFDDYLAALPSKYRRRAGRARRKFAGLTRRSLTVGEAAAESAAIARLYADLIARSDYVPFRVPGGYAAALKRLAPERVDLAGYYDGERLVGYATLLTDGGRAIAHYCAVDPDYNPSHQLYLNLLFDLLAQAIAAGARTLHYGRTATTIKSSVGARPVEQVSLMTHDGCARRQMLATLNERVMSGGARDAPVQRPLG